MVGASHVVRTATLTDVDALLMLMGEASPGLERVPPDSATARALEALLDDSRLGQVWLIEYDGHPAGFVVMTVGFSMEWGGLRGFIENFFVTPRYRGQGLAHAALEQVKLACRRRGVRALLVENSPEEAAALNAYRRAGFAATDTALLVLPLIGDS